MTNAYALADKEIDLEIYLRVPGKKVFDDRELTQFEAKSGDHLVLKSKKAMYEFTQAGNLWSQLLHDNLTKAKCQRCITEMRLLYKGIKET